MAKSPSRDEDEDDDRPRRRPAARRPHDGDDDERPRRKSRPEPDPDEDDDEDDRPRKKPNKGGLPAGTPRVYVHKKCRESTEMPIDIIREYLENPFELGEEPTTQCSHCEDDFPWKDFKWEETNENCYEYLDELRGKMIVEGNDPRPERVSYNVGYPIGGAIICAAIGGALSKPLGQPRVILGAAGAGVGLLIGAVYMLIQRGRDQTEQDEWNRKLIARYYKRHPELKPAKKKKPRDDDDDE
jgi:hypothetical protein